MKKFRVWCVREQVGMMTIEAEDEDAAWEQVADQDPLQNVIEVGSSDWSLTGVDEAPQ